MNRKIQVLLVLVLCALVSVASAQHVDHHLRDELRAIDFRIIGARAFSPDYEYILQPERNRVIPRGDNVYELELVFIHKDLDELLRNRDRYTRKIYITLYYDGRQFIFFTNAINNEVDRANIRMREYIASRANIGMERTFRFWRYRTEEEYRRGGNRYEQGAGDLRIVFDAHNY